jgi:hypothetical protein
MAAKNQVLKSFDMDALRRKRSAASAKADPTALITGLNQIAPEIAALNVGETVRIPLPEGIAMRGFVMSITAKLSNLTPKGAPWAGRTYDTLSDADAGERGVVYVQRGPDGEAKERKRGRTGGRKAAATPAKQEGAIVTT